VIRSSAARFTSRRSEEPAQSATSSPDRSAASSSGRSSSMMNWVGTMKVWVIRSRGTVSRKAAGSKRSIATSVPPANSTGSIISQVPLE
jgi:hypothetical protein